MGPDRGAEALPLIFALLVTFIKRPLLVSESEAPSPEEGAGVPVSTRSVIIPLFVPNKGDSPPVISICLKFPSRNPPKPEAGSKDVPCMSISFKISTLDLSPADVDLRNAASSAGVLMMTQLSSRASSPRDTLSPVVISNGVLDSMI